MPEQWQNVLPLQVQLDEIRLQIFCRKGQTWELGHWTPALHRLVPNLAFQAWKCLALRWFSLVWNRKSSRTERIAWKHEAETQKEHKKRKETTKNTAQTGRNINAEQAQYDAEAVSSGMTKSVKFMFDVSTSLMLFGIAQPGRRPPVCFLLHLWSGSSLWEALSVLQPNKAPGLERKRSSFACWRHSLNSHFVWYLGLSYLKLLENKFLNRKPCHQRRRERKGCRAT